MRVLDELEREIERVAIEAGDVRKRRFGARLAVLPLSLAAIAVAAAMSCSSAAEIRRVPVEGGEEARQRLRHAGRPGEAARHPHARSGRRAAVGAADGHDHARVQLRPDRPDWWTAKLGSLGQDGSVPRDQAGASAS